MWILWYLNWITFIFIIDAIYVYLHCILSIHFILWHFKYNFNDVLYVLCATFCGFQTLLFEQLNIIGSLEVSSHHLDTWSLLQVHCTSLKTGGKRNNLKICYKNFNDLPCLSTVAELEIRTNLFRCFCFFFFSFVDFLTAKNQKEIHFFCISFRNKTEQKTNIEPPRTKAPTEPCVWVLMIEMFDFP